MWARPCLWTQAKLLKLGCPKWVALAFLVLCGCAHGPSPASGFYTRFALPAQPTLMLISPTWSDRGLAMLELIREAKRKHKELQVVVVVLDDLPPAAWQVAAEALKVPGAVRRPQGLGLERKPFGPVREVPLVYWVGRDERIWQRGLGYIDAEAFHRETKSFMESQ